MKLKSLLLGIVLASAAVSSASTIVQTGNFSFVPNDSSAQTFNQFDTMGGTRVLNSVYVTVSFTKSGGSYSVDNESHSSATVTLTHTVTGSLDAGDLDLSTSSGYFGIPTSVLKATSTVSGVVLGADDGDSPTNMDNSGPDYYRFDPGDVTKSTSGYITDIAQFEGNSDYVMTFSADQTVNISGVSGASQAFSPSQVNGYISVTYDYTSLSPVPEPSSYVGIGIAAIVLCGFRHRARI